MNNKPHFKNNILQKPVARAILAVIIFLLAVGVFSFVMIHPYSKIYSNSNNYDLVFIGASESEWGINPAIIDERLGTKSIVIGSSGATLDARLDFVKSAIQQDNLDTVVLDVSYYAMVKNLKDYPVDYKTIYITRLGSFSNVMEAAGRQLSFLHDDYDALYGEFILHGAKTWKSILTGHSAEVYLSRGYDRQYEQADQTIAPEDAASLLDSSKLQKLRKENCVRLREILQTLEDRGVRIIVASYPFPSSFVWKNTGWEAFQDAMLSITKDYNCTYYDFNLLKNKENYFDDATSFRDYEHLHDNGATILSQIMADIINAEKTNQPIAYEFYDNYAEAKAGSIYSNYLN